MDDDSTPRDRAPRGSAPHDRATSADDRDAHAPDPSSRLAEADDADVTVEVDRIAVDGTYVRVSSIGQPGDRAFVLVAGLGIAATYYERLAPHLNENGPVHALDLPASRACRTSAAGSRSSGTRTPSRRSSTSSVSRTLCSSDTRWEPRS